MKSFLSFFLILFLVSGYSVAQDLSVFDTDPNVTAQADTIPPGGFPLPTKWHFNYSTNTTLNAGTVGAIFFNGNFYFNRWNAGPCYLLPPDANGMPDPNNIVTIQNPPYNGAIRDMTIAPDMSGTPYLWGGTATSTLYKMDAGMNVKGTYNVTGADFRAIAFDPVTGGFWNGDFSGAANCHDTTGALIASSPTASAIASKYGMGWSSSAWFPTTNNLWVWSQVTGGTTALLTAIDVATDVTVGSYTFTLPGGSVGIPGGAEVCILNGEYVLLLNYQNFAIGCYFIAVVPVELTSFTATAQTNSVVLNWSTSTETNNQGFEIERAHNGIVETVGFVAGFGTTSEPKSYSFVDSNVEPGIYSYRLKQIDYDGTFKLHMAQQVEVFAPAEFSLTQNYPNPFNPSTKIDFSLAVDSRVTLNIYNVLGEQVATLLNSNIAAGSHSVDFNAAGLNSGVYLYKINAVGIDGQEFTQVRKMTLTK
jgi:hypothetical protein